MNLLTGLLALLSPQTTQQYTDYDRMRAVTMISAPMGTIETTTEEEFPAIRAAVHAVAIEQQLVDTCETHCVMARITEFQSSLDMIRRRAVELRQAPLVSDAMRFPNRDTINSAMAFNRRYRKHLETRLLLEKDRKKAIQEAIDETDSLYSVWDIAHNAQTGYYNVNVRREALLLLKNRLGEEAFAKGELPNYVPTWRFVEYK